MENISAESGIHADIYNKLFSQKNIGNDGMLELKPVYLALIVLDLQMHFFAGRLNGCPVNIFLRKNKTFIKKL